MKKIFFLGTFLLASTIMFAQDMTAATERADKRTEAMATSLQLTSEQKASVKQLLTGIEMKQEVARNEASFTDEQRAEQLKGNQDAEMMRLKDILTEDQYARHEQATKGTSRKTTGKTEVPMLKQK